MRPYVSIPVGHWSTSLINYLDKQSDSPFIRKLLIFWEEFSLAHASVYVAPRVLVKIVTLQISKSRILEGNKNRQQQQSSLGTSSTGVPFLLMCSFCRSRHCCSLLPRCQQECPISANLFLVTRTPVTKELDKNNHLSHQRSKPGSN